MTGIRLDAKVEIACPSFNEGVVRSQSVKMLILPGIRGSLSQCESSTWKPEMEDPTVTTLRPEHVIEIILPEREEACDDPAAICLCCGRRSSKIDEDCCGICEECLAP